MQRVFKAFVKKSFKSVWAPFMFSNLLATFWSTYGLFGDRSMVHIQLMGASKMLVGVSETGWGILKAHHGQLSLNVGLSVKDISSREFLSADDANNSHDL